LAFYIALKQLRFDNNPTITILLIVPQIIITLDIDSTSIKKHLYIKKSLVMSSRAIQFGLLSLISSALARPAGVSYTGSEGGFYFPSGLSGVAAPSGGFHHHHVHHSHANITASQTMEALDTGVAVGAAAASTTSCTTSTHYSTTTEMVTVTMTGDDSAGEDVPATTTDISVDSTIFASSVEATSSSTPAAAAAASSTVELQEARFSHTSTTAVPATTAATSAATSSPQASSTPAASGAKRGVAYNLPSLVKPFVGQKEVSWAYNWQSTSGSGFPSGVEYVPMLWGNTATYTGNWEKDANAGIAAGATALLGFNEPDHTAQANISPADAATSYKTYLSDKFGGKKVKLGSPAVTNGPAPMGLDWLNKFMSACSSCQVDFVVSYPVLSCHESSLLIPSSGYPLV
jgi:hypothetical protein